VMWAALTGQVLLTRNGWAQHLRPSLHPQATLGSALTTGLLPLHMHAACPLNVSALVTS